jgi:superfamily II DNA or RNA helicase
MEQFRHGDLTVLASVGVLTEGFDAPAAEVCILARPTKSLALHIQMIGRVLRTSPDTGKVRALIHDHAGNTMRHGLPDEPRDYALNVTPQRVIASMTCPACYAVFNRTKQGRCPKCDELISTPEERSDSGGRMDKTVVEGKRISREQIEQIRGRRASLGLTRELTDQQIAKAARATREEKAAEYLRLKVIAERKGFKNGFIAHQFRGQFSHWPRFTDDELAAAQPAAQPFLPLPKRGA